MITDFGLEDEPDFIVLDISYLTATRSALVIIPGIEGVIIARKTQEKQFFECVEDNLLQIL
jgi:hypothetical protein